MDQHNNPKLIDFGISKKYDLSNDQETSTALLAASKGYASIEQYDNEGIQIFSPCPDIYSLGATMYYLVTGQVPTESILRSTKGMQRPSELNPEISENTENVILKAMALNAADRYQSVMEMLLDLGFDPVVDKVDLFTTSLTEYPEITSNVSDDPYDFDEEDETKIRFINTDANKKQKNYNWLYFVIPSIVSGIMAFILFGNFWEKKPNNIPTNPIHVDNNVDTIYNNQDLPTEITPVVNNDKQDSMTNNVVNQTLVPENFQRFFNEAVLAYNNRDFSRSLELLNQAELYMITAETEQYKASSKLEIEKIEIEKRKNNYEIVENYGKFVAVNEKLSKKFGVIDENGNIVIPCEYIYTERYGVNRLFQRNDKLYDIWSPSSGELINTGINGSDLEL